MTALIFYVARGALAPSVSLLALDDTGHPMDLSRFSRAQFLMQSRTTGLRVITADAVFEDQSGGALRYDWHAGDTDEPGVFFAEFVLTGRGAGRLYVPVRGHIRIEIDEGPTPEDGRAPKETD